MIGSSTKRRMSIFAGEYKSDDGIAQLTISSSNAMPKSVREALAWCISTEGAGDMSVEAAEQYVEGMFDQGRGGEESW